MSDFKLCILTPTTGSTRMAFTVGLYKLVCYFMRNKICDSEQSLSFNAIEGAGVSANRETLVKSASDFTHILFIDEDMGFEPETLYSLAGRKMPIVGCNYRTRMEGGNFTAMSLKGERVTLDDSKTGIEQVYYTGFGFCLIKRDVFDKIKRPWFLHSYNNGEYTTEDSGFAAKAKEAGIPWHVDHDASKMIYHVGSKNYSWRKN
ncbi:MAG: hypothetical protein KAJ19_08090 [Gammaproteobacteria bacterium]|nr:hypothetical protein [Gammaproteobacteria bacterium]